MENIVLRRQMPVYLAKYLTVSLFLVLLVSNLCAQSFKWESVLPEEEGFSSQKLYAMRDSLAAHKTTSIIIIRNDRIVLEWYAPGWDPTKQHGTASSAKALVGGMSLLLALTDGRLEPDDYAWKYIPQWKDDPLKSKITIRELATHSSGIEDAEISDKDIADAKAKGIVIKDQHMDLPGWKGNFWKRTPDPFTLSRDDAPILYTPGTKNSYSNPGMAMMSYAITASYKGTKYKDVRTLLQDRIYRPIGMKDDEWKIGYGSTYHVDGLDLVANWGGASFLPRGAARIGRLMLHKGNWDGKQLIDSTWVKRVTAYAGMPLPPRGSADNLSPAHGLAWYTNFDGVCTRAPRDLYF